MINFVWHYYFYQPLLNGLIWIYNSSLANGNMGWAVVWLTIFLRIFLLPLTIISAHNNARRLKAIEEAKEAIKVFRNDAVAQREAARKIMKKYHISPWAKAVMLGVQVLVLVLLYQVFIGGITGDKLLKNLYPFVDFPGKINANFYGFDIGRPHDIIWAGIAAAYLFMSVFIEMRTRAYWEKSDMVYLFAFPLFTLAVLWYLPMVKSLFILTTMLFSDIIGMLSYLLFSSKKKPVTHAAPVAGAASVAPKPKSLNRH